MTYVPLIYFLIGDQRVLQPRWNSLWFIVTTELLIVSRNSRHKCNDHLLDAPGGAAICCDWSHGSGFITSSQISSIE